MTSQPSIPAVPPTVGKALRDGLATCAARRRFTPEAQRAISDLCVLARQNGWTPEQLLVTVKDACYTSPEFVSLNSTSEREFLVASVVTGCITEFYEPNGPG